MYDPCPEKPRGVPAGLPRALLSQEAIFKGIPGAERVTLWKQMCYRPFPASFEALSQADVSSETLQQIRNDAVRTLSESTHSPLLSRRRESLGRLRETLRAPSCSADTEVFKRDLEQVLVAFANYHHSIGYCQGLSCYAAFLLLFFPKEEAFEMLCSTVAVNRLEGLFDKNLSLVTSLLATHRAVLEITLPEAIRKHVELLAGGSHDYSVGWYLTFFSRCDPLLYARLADFFFYFGFPVLFHVASAFMELGYFKYMAAERNSDARKHLLFKIPYLHYDERDLVKIVRRNMQVMDVCDVQKFFLP